MTDNLEWNWGESGENAAPVGSPERRQYIRAKQVCLPDFSARQRMTINY